MLSKNVQEHGSDWDLHLPFVLFTYMEIPHSTTGMSPFHLVYGRLPSGPISLLKEVWTIFRKVELDDGGIRELHFNKLRSYIARVGQVLLIFDQDSDFGDLLYYAPTDMAVTSMGDVTDHIRSDCQELEHVQ
ncbi:pro-Pol polyprotein [Trichonephila clavipes]|nr:pro-Pol polyprotein [Trichonephila clavipes]